jgi:hypothetical protein
LSAPELDSNQQQTPKTFKSLYEYQPTKIQRPSIEIPIITLNGQPSNDQANKRLSNQAKVLDIKQSKSPTLSTKLNKSSTQITPDVVKMDDYAINVWNSSEDYGSDDESISYK